MYSLHATIEIVSAAGPVKQTVIVFFIEDSMSVICALCLRVLRAFRPRISQCLVVAFQACTQGRYVRCVSVIIGEPCTPTAVTSDVVLFCLFGLS